MDDATPMTTLTVTVRYFAGAQVAAGTGEETLDLPVGARVIDLVRVLAARHGAELARVLTAASFLVDEVTGPADRALRDGVRVDVLPPFAGG